MKKRLLHIVRLVTFLVALQILNVDFFIQDCPEIASLSYPGQSDNDDEDQVDSVGEYFSEVFFKKIKARPRNNNKPNKHLQAHKHMGLKMVELQQERYLFTAASFKENNRSSFIKNYHYQFCKEITPPPPKA